MSTPAISLPNPPASSSSSKLANILVKWVFLGGFLFFLIHLIIYSELFVSQIPSQPKIINSACFLYMTTTSGKAMTICLLEIKLGLLLNWKSPSARLKFKLPFILPWALTFPPACWIRTFYAVLHGLCSKFNYFNPFVLPSYVLIETTALLSPALAQYIFYFVRSIAKAVQPAIVSLSYRIAFLSCAFYFRIYSSYCLPYAVSIIWSKVPNADTKAF